LRILFAFNVFGQGYTFWQAILALLIYLILTYIIFIVLVIFWRWEWVGVTGCTGRNLKIEMNRGFPPLFTFV